VTIFKRGCVVWALHPALEKALASNGPVDKIFRQEAGRHAFVTSVCDEGHAPNSYHYYGRAADLRTNDLSLDISRRCERRIQVRLGPDWHVELEYIGTDNEHIHMEYRGE
jgi:hypothetical protein